MERKLSWPQIVDTYKDEWVELIDYQWSLADPAPSEGVVRTHSSDRHEFNRLISENPATDSAIIFTGRIHLPEDAYLHANLRLSPK